ncbi:MAG: ABC transporter permease [Gammaproteobacteria bacterium]|nr:ABC transporter permease [Gammaproteobacteria bacterium]MBV9697585.1 ABC transporter permease [Gammaproteobacteria bacterium]
MAAAVVRVGPARRLEPLGALLTLAGCAALLALPFVSVKANRIVPGEPLGVLGALPFTDALALYVLLAATAAAALWVGAPRLRLLAALVALGALAAALGFAGQLLTPAGNRVVRIAPGGAFWVVLICLGLLATDALTRLKPRPLLRVLALIVLLGAGVAALGSGWFDHLSILREYAVNAPRFAHELRRHVLLAFGSLAAAACVGLPLGILCHRVPRLRSGILGTLNVIQTTPAIALFGILMAPLGALAGAWPALQRAGVSGIGAAPAVVALFLYSLLPIVANTAGGLARVSRAAVDAARGMGMTPRQVLTAIELRLALPVIITGVRVVLVQNIGMVTVAALIGGGGLGTFVFQGIGQTAIDLVLLGAIPIVALAFSAAVLLDAAAETLERR